MSTNDNSRPNFPDFYGPEPESAEQGSILEMRLLFLGSLSVH